VLFNIDHRFDVTAANGARRLGTITCIA